MRGTLRVQCDTKIDLTKIDPLFSRSILSRGNRQFYSQSLVLARWRMQRQFETACQPFHFTVAPRTTPRFRELVVVAPLLLDYIVFSTLVNKSRYFVTMLLFRLTNRRCLASRHTEHGNAPNDQSTSFHSSSTPIGA